MLELSLRRINSPLPSSSRPTANILCSSYGIRTHILDLEDRCPVQLNEGTILFPYRHPLRLSEMSERMNNNLYAWSDSNRHRLPRGSMFLRHRCFTVSPQACVSFFFCDPDGIRTHTVFLVGNRF